MGAPVCQTYAPPVNRSAPRTIMDALNIIHATLLHNMWCTHHYMCHTCIINDEPTVNIARNRKEKIGATLHSGFASNPLFRWCENNIFWTLGSNQAILGCPNVSCPAQVRTPDQDRTWPRTPPPLQSAPDFSAAIGVYFSGTFTG